jgi:acyl dehydratase
MSSDARAQGELTGVPVSWEVRQEDLVRYSAVARDFNPVHYDAEAADAAGFDRPTAQGMVDLALVLAWATDAVGIELDGELVADRWMVVEPRAATQFAAILGTKSEMFLRRDGDRSTKQRSERKLTSPTSRRPSPTSPVHTY